MDLALVGQRGIPEVVLAPRSGRNEASELRRVVADDVAAAVLAGRAVVEAARHVAPFQVRAAGASLKGAATADQECTLGNRSRLGIRIVAGVGAVGVIEQVVGRRAFEADRQLAQLLALDPPVALAHLHRVVMHGRGRCRIRRRILVPASGVVSPNADLDRIAGRPILIDLRFAGELEARLLQVVRADVDVALSAIVPEERGFVDPARDRQADFAVALAGRGRLEIGDALL